MRFRNSIAIPLILFFLSIVAGIFLTGYFINENVFYHVFEERESNKARNIHLTIGSILSLETKKLAGFSNVLKNDTDLHYGLYHYKVTGGDRKPLASAMNQLNSQMNLQIFCMATAGGNILYSASRSDVPELPFGDETFQRAQKGEQVLAVTHRGGRWSLRSYVPIHFSGRKRPSGILVLGNRIDDGFVSKIARETGSQLLLATADNVIASSFRDRGPVRIEQSLARKTLQLGKPLFYADRKDFRSYTYIPLQILDREFCLIIETDISVIQDLLRKNRTQLAEWGIVLFLGITLIGCVVLYMLIRPLNRLEEKARQVISQYSPGEPTPAPRGNEISTLVRAFGTMVNAIESHIAERNRAEEALRESSRMLESLIEASPLAIFETDPEGILRVWNPAAESIFGWSRKDSLNRPIPVLADERNAELQAACRRTLLGESISNLELPCTVRSGAALTLSFSGAPLLDVQGNLVGMTAILADITEAKRAEEALRQSEEKLVQSQKMEAIGRLAGGVAHDFNNILSVILGYSELLLARLEEQFPERREIEEIFRAGERASALTQQLLAFSRLQVLQPKVLKMDEVVSAHSQMLRRLIGETYELTLDFAPGCRPIKADPNQIGQILMNLVVNARDAMPGEGAIRIRLRDVVFADPFQDGKMTIPKGRYTQIEVTDSGCGMDPETVSRIFEPFFTTKEQGKGTGLGLATIYGIVKQTGGFIRVASRLGEGTSFFLYFPAVDPGESGAEEPPRKPGTRELTGKETLLVVEDEEMVRDLMCAVLKEYGYTVLEASTGAEAIGIGKRYAGTIHLLVTDMVMPGISGIETARELAAYRPGIPILYISGYSHEAIRQLGEGIPAGAFLQKPITPTKLLASVRDILLRNGSSSGDPRVTFREAGAPSGLRRSRE